MIFGPKSPENTYVASYDQNCREAGWVYVQDLAISSVLVALKSSARPPLFAALNLNPVFDALPEFDKLEEFHGDLSERVSTAARRILVPKGTEIPSPAFPEVMVTKNYYGQIEVSADYWEVSPIKAGFIASRKQMDAKSLTGFVAFDPRGYDGEARNGKAQDIVDKLRTQALV